ncbi:MAG: hypothetical protein KJZ69_15935 [Phycisphaerales bacterium]|nr:hypothetical protein [Phycisphaerales bacterium]
MPLILGPSGSTLLLGPTGLPATSTNCCCCKEGVDCPHCECCECWVCGDGFKHALPTAGCHNASGKACLTVTLSGLTFATGCRTFRGNDCVAAPGTWASYKYLSSAMSDLVLPFNYNDGPQTPMRNPDSPCSDIDPNTVCRQWKMCVVLPDTGIDATQYSNANCTGTANTFNVAIASAVLNYQVIGTTKRFILWVTALPGGGIPIPIFFGVANFDARQCANYSTWPLVINNGLASTACLCGGSGAAMHPAATGGTATLTMACDTNCDGSEGSAALTSTEVAGPPIAPHRFDDAKALDLADAVDERRCRCGRMKRWR